MSGDIASIRALVDGRSQIPAENLERLRLLSAYALRNLEGDPVECGVYKGGSAAVIGQSALEAGRRLWLFDSFEGLPQPTAKDGPFAREFAGTGVGSVEEVRDHLGRAGIAADQVAIRPGPFEETFRGDLPERVAFLHVDACWYESVLASLRAFYDLLPSGAVVVLDDFGYWEGCREAYYDFVAERRIKPLLERCGVSQAYWLKERLNNRDGYF